jgi:ABC-type transport system involved in multi-copper enzyme maturation permease subunit
MLAIVLETDPLKLEAFPTSLASWLMTAGGVAIQGLVLWIVFRVLLGFGAYSQERRLSIARFIVAAAIFAAVLTVLPAGMQWLWNYLGWVDPMATAVVSPWDQIFVKQSSYTVSPFEGIVLRYGAAFALAVVLLPVLLNIPRISVRRVWALTKLSFKEAVRRRILWVFSLMLLIFLFGQWFYKPTKEEDQLRTYVNTVFFGMTVLLLLTAALLASFSLPTDLKNQTIHTIVTKPVERFEIVIGRFLGFTALMTLVLVVMSAVSLVYVARGISAEAAEQSYKARVPIYGELFVQGGKNVGYEWEYRKYITVPDRPEELEFAVWAFPTVPREFGMRADPTIRCEFTFDIFRTTKGREEGKGILVSLLFQNWQCKPGRLPGVPAQLEEYRREREQLLIQASADSSLMAIENDLATKFGIFEIPDKEITDFHTLAVDVPSGLFKNLESWYALPAPRPPALQVFVRCVSRTQYLGIAKHDLYLLASTRGFEQNFFKAAVGLWFRLCLVIGVAVACSTLFSGVISLLVTMYVYLMGLLLPFGRTLVEGKTIGGGSFENALRLVTGAHASMPLDPSPLVTVAQSADRGFSRTLEQGLKWYPDIERYDLTRFVEEGFDISGVQLAITGALLVGYLLPWMVLAFYLIRAREVAS